MRILRIEAPHFVAGMIWDGGWKAVAPIIHWLTKKPVREVPLIIKRKGWKYQWL